MGQYQLQRMIRKHTVIEVPRRVAMLLTLIVALAGPGQLNGLSSPNNAVSGTVFEIAFDKYVHDDSIVGAAYVLVKDGQAAEWHSVGMADREGNQPVNQNTIFHWGSITKTLTAVAVMQLRDRHKISLDDSITKYVPELN